MRGESPQRGSAARVDVHAIARGDNPITMPNTAIFAIVAGALVVELFALTLAQTGPIVWWMKRRQQRQE